jgi:serine/threonine-protein kinase
MLRCYTYNSFNGRLLGETSLIWFDWLNSFLCNHQQHMNENNSFQPISFEDRYQIGRRLWYDGPHSGCIAFDRLMQREVILNIPYRPEDNERFLSDVQFRARFRHSNLMPIYDFNFTSDDKPYFTAPYIPTVNLKELDCTQTDSTLPKQIGFLIQSCEALNYLHASNLLHLCLSPREVLISKPHQEVFLEVNLPMMLAAESTHRDPGAPRTLYRTLAYMAPEQIDPDRFGLGSVQSDVYGLGGILYFILYGYSPNMADPKAQTKAQDIIKMLADRNGPPEKGKLRFTRRDHRKLAKRLEPICLRALHSDRAKRHKDVAQFSQDLSDALIG